MERRPLHRPEALELSREADNPTGIALAFMDLVFLLTWEALHENANRLVGVSGAYRQRAGGGPTPGFGGMLEGDPVADARAHLTEEAAQPARQEGLTLSVQEAVALAQADTSPGAGPSRAGRGGARPVGIRLGRAWIALLHLATA